MNIKIFLISLILLVTGITSVHADDINLPHVSVFGTAVKKVVPDKMLWNVQVMNKDQSLEDVTKKHIDIVGRVTRLLNSEGIKEDLQTTRMEFGENWTYQSRSRVKEGYFARTYITFSMTDFNKYKKIWLGLAAIEDVSVQNVGYDHTDRINIQNETRVKALKEAKNKASILAESIGSKIAEPISIEEEWAGDDVIMNNVRMIEKASFDGQSSSSVSPGLISVRMRVKASFRLVTTGE
ncbi:MAG: SIMPL domain-containing protein [Desulfobacteraceae bacterium]|jgi:uncharacterized protein YggE